MIETETRGGITRATYDAIESVYRREPRTAPRSDYSERPTAYMVKFRGDARLRRVYATPLGNVAVFYVKTRDGLIYVELALDAALHRA